MPMAPFEAMVESVTSAVVIFAANPRTKMPDSVFPRIVERVTTAFAPDRVRPAAPLPRIVESVICTFAAAVT
jgi:hypothetical protein